MTREPEPAKIGERHEFSGCVATLYTADRERLGAMGCRRLRRRRPSVWRRHWVEANREMLLKGWDEPGAWATPLTAEEARWLAGLVA